MKKAFNKLMKNTVYSKTIENLRNRTDLRQQKRLFKMDIKTKLYVTRNI